MADDTRPPDLISRELVEKGRELHRIGERLLSEAMAWAGDVGRLFDLVEPALGHLDEPDHVLMVRAAGLGRLLHLVDAFAGIEVRRENES